MATGKTKRSKFIDSLTSSDADTIVFHRLAKSTKDFVDSLKRNSIKVSDTQKANNESFLERMKKTYQEYNKNRFTKPNFEELLPESFEKTKKVYGNRSEEDIANQAYKELVPKYQDLKQKATEKTDNSVNSLNEKLLKEQEKTKEKISNLDASESIAEKQLQDKMLMQGLTYSSINEGEKQNIDAIYEEKKKILNESLANYTSEIERAKVNLKKQLDNSLNLYKLNYSKDLMLKIDKLSLEEDKLQRSIESYNQKVENEYLRYIEDRQNRLSNLEKDYYSKAREETLAEREWEDRNKTFSAEKLPEMQKRLKEAEAFYTSMPKNVSLKLLHENEKDLKNYLSIYYDKLLNTIKNK